MIVEFGFGMLVVTFFTALFAVVCRCLRSMEI